MPRLLALLACFTGVVAQTPIAPTKKDCIKLVENYLDAGTTRSSRDTIATRLRQADRGLLITPIRRGLTSKTQQAQALLLATELRVPSLFSRVSKHIDSDIEDLVADYGAALWDDRATRLLWTRWKSLDQVSTSWTIANRAFRKHNAPPAILDLMRSHYNAEASPPAKLGSLHWIIRASLGRPKLSAADLSAGWRNILQTYRDETRSFNMKGDPLLPQRDPKKDWSISILGDNVRISSDGGLSVMPQPWWQDTNLTVSAHLRPRTGTTVKMGLESTSGHWIITYMDGEWTTGSGDHVVYALKGQPDEWTELSFVVTQRPPDELNPNQRAIRRCDLLVNGESLMQNGNHNGTLKNVYIWVPKGKCSVSSMQVLR